MDQDSARLLSRNLCAVVSVVLVLDLLESSDSLSVDLASSVASPSSGGGGKSRVDLRVQLAVIISGEDLDISSLIDGLLGVALSTVSVTVGLGDLLHPAVDLGDVSGILGVVHVKGFGSKSVDVAGVDESKDGGEKLHFFLFFC